MRCVSVWMQFNSLLVYCVIVCLCGARLLQFDAIGMKIIRLSRRNGHALFVTICVQAQAANASVILLDFIHVCAVHVRTSHWNNNVFIMVMVIAIQYVCDWRPYN